MPSAATAKVEKPRVTDFLDSFKQAVIVVEHKIRNLEKRKVKLDAYKEEQGQGKELNADQLAAVAKYNEVVQQLDFSRDLVKQLTQIGEETNRAYKKQQKKEIADRNVTETERFRQLLHFQDVLERIVGNQNVRNDFLSGMHGAAKLEEENLATLEQFAELIKPSTENGEFAKRLESAADHLSSLFHCKAKAVAGSTYKDIHALLVTVSTCDYFKTNAQVNQTQVDDSTVSPNNSSSNANVHAPAPEQAPAPPTHPQNDSAYNFMQDSQIDIESPHMDPAVVAISCFPPPPLQQGGQAVFANPVEHLNNRLNEVSLNSKNQEDDWDNTGSNVNFNATTTGEADEETKGDSNNGFDRGQRGYRSRGGRGRGLSNGYSRGGGSRGRGSYQNGGGRGGYRNDYRGERAEGGEDFNAQDGGSRGNRSRGEGRGGRGSHKYSNNASQSNNAAYNSGATNYENNGTHAGHPRSNRPSQGGRGGYQQGSKQ